MYSLLIVDDEPAILAGMCHILDWSVYGVHRIETARDVKEGLARAIDINPDICLIDVCIGSDKGYELIHRIDDLGIRSNYIMMSGYSEFKFAIESMRSGAREYLLKPIETKKLADTVEKIIMEELGGSIHRIEPERQTDPVLFLPCDILPPIVAKTLMIIKAEYGQKISLKTIANLFRMNATYLGQIFFKETGMKFNDYLMRYRLLKAREWIEGTEEKIGSIASQVGYSNLNYFYTHFHAFYGVSPSDMRSRADLANQEKMRWNSAADR